MRLQALFLLKHGHFAHLYRVLARGHVQGSKYCLISCSCCIAGGKYGERA